MVDHLVHRQQLPVLAGRGGELAEHVLPAAFLAPAQRFGAEELAQEFAPLHSAAHPSERQRRADGGDAGLHHVDEGGVDPVSFRPPFDADEAFRGKVERQLLDLRPEAQAPFPAIHFLRDAAIERTGIMAHRPRLERDGQRPPVGTVVIEIQQHQPAGKQAVQHGAPPLVGGEVLGPVHQHQFVGFRPDQRDLPGAEDMRLVDRAVGLEHPLGEGVRVGGLLERMADDRGALLTRNMVERAVRLVLRPVPWRRALDRRGHRLGRRLGAGGFSEGGHDVALLTDTGVNRLLR